TVLAAHLEAFDSIDAIAHEKAAIMDGLVPGGTAILNADIPQAAILRDHASELGVAALDFGETARDYRLLDAALQDDVTIARAQAMGKPLLFRIASPGRHFAMNGLGALAAAD